MMMKEKIIMCEYIGLAILMAKKIDEDGVADQLQKVIDGVDINVHSD